MKKPLAACALAVAAVAAAPSPAGKPIPPHYSKIPFPALDFRPPHPKDHRVELPGGAVAYLVPDSAIDVVKLSLYCARRNLPRKPEEAAALRLYSSLLKDGGTQRLSPEQLEDSLEFIAASLTAGLRTHQSEAQFDALGRNAAEMLGLLPEVALKPRLDAEAFKVEQRKLLEGLKHRYNTPQGVMASAYERVLQGSHPANWMPQEAEVSALSPKALKPWSGTGYTRKGMVLGVSGRFDRPEMIRALESFVKAFPAGGDTLPLPPFPGPRRPGVYLVNKEFQQATLRLGAPGVQRPHPDYYRLAVASYVFGEGGFTSRLMTRVRSDEGLAYGVGSQVESDYHRRGTVYVGLQTKAPTGAYAVKLVLEEMRRMAQEGITDEELAKAKDGLLKSLPTLFDTPAATARIFAQGEIWGRSLDHFVEYERKLKAMTRAEVEDAFRRYFVADSLRIVAVGPKDVLLRKDGTHGVSLADFGAVTELTLEELDRRD